MYTVLRDDANNQLNNIFNMRQGWQPRNQIRKLLKEPHVSAPHGAEGRGGPTSPGSVCGGARARHMGVCHVGSHEHMSRSPLRAPPIAAVAPTERAGRAHIVHARPCNAYFEARNLCAGCVSQARAMFKFFSAICLAQALLGANTAPTNPLSPDADRSIIEPAIDVSFPFALEHCAHAWARVRPRPWQGHPSPGRTSARAPLRTWHMPHVTAAN